VENQRRYTIRCLLYIKYDTHKWLTKFSELQNLISLILATCEGTTVLYTVWRYNCTVHSVKVQLFCTECEGTTVLYTV
jgi:hypothetical protein